MRLWAGCLIKQRTLTSVVEAGSPSFGMFEIRHEGEGARNKLKMAIVYSHAKQKDYSCNIHSLKGEREKKRPYVHCCTEC